MMICKSHAHYGNTFNQIQNWKPRLPVLNTTNNKDQAHDYGTSTISNMSWSCECENNCMKRTYIEKTAKEQPTYGNRTNVHTHTYTHTYLHRCRGSCCRLGLVYRRQICDKQTKNISTTPTEGENARKDNKDEIARTTTYGTQNRTMSTVHQQTSKHAKQNRQGKTKQRVRRCWRPTSNRKTRNWPNNRGT